MREPDDLTGRRFGKLLVVSISEPYVSPSGVKRYAWNCICDCGNECVVRSDYLRRGQKLHCNKCPPPEYKYNNNLCRNCEHSKRDNRGGWICKKGLDPNNATSKCSGFLCGRTDKITGVKHRESKCFICGKPVYSNGNDIAIYCEEHKAFAKLDDELIQTAPMELLFVIISGIFLRARDDYLFNTDGKRKDAESFFRSTWAKELSLWRFDADETINMLNEVIRDGLDGNRNGASC